jgi:hypothetical protein
MQTEGINMTLETNVEGFFGGLVAELKTLVSNFSASAFGQGLKSSVDAVLSEVGSIGKQQLTNIVASGAGAAAAAAATGGGEAVVLSAAAAAMRSQATSSGVQITTAALASLAGHVASNVITSAAAPAAPAAPAQQSGANNLDKVV